MNDVGKVRKWEQAALQYCGAKMLLVSAKGKDFARMWEILEISLRSHGSQK